MRRTIESKFSAVTRFALALGVAGAIAAVGIIPVAAQSAPNPYAHGTSAYWAWQNRPDLPSDLGPAPGWARSAAAEGWPVGPFPRPGDIAVFPPGAPDGITQPGYLALVGQVFDDGSYSATQLVEQACEPPESGSCSRVASRTYPVLPGALFIHYKIDTRTTWGFGGGASGWTALNISQGSMRAPGWYYPLNGTGPEIESPDLRVPLASYDTVVIDMATDESVSDQNVQVFFSTAEHPEVTFSKRVLLRARADGGLHTYCAYFGANEFWGGTLTRLYLRPAGPGSFGGVRIDRVRLVNSGLAGPVSLLPYTAAH